MKRGKPLERRTPLKARGGHLARSGLNGRRTRLSPLSAKRRAESDERKRIVADAIDRAGGVCAAAALVPDVPCFGPLTGDEIKGRGVNPGGHLDPSNVQCLCARHNTWKEDEPDRAYALGLKRRSWE